MSNPLLKPQFDTSRPNKLLKNLKSALRKKNHRFALQLCQELDALNVKSPEFSHLHGEVLMHNNKTEEAIVKFNEAHTAQPDNPAFLNSMGEAFFKLREHEVAVELFKRATEADQGYFRAWNNLGFVLRALERYNSAELAYHCAHRLQPTEIDPLIGLVELYVEIRDYEKADKLSDQALRLPIKKGLAKLHLRRLQIAGRMEVFDLIEERYKKINMDELTINERAEVDNVKAFQLNLLGMNDEAIEVLKPWEITITSNHAQILSQFGVIYYAMGEYDKAIEYHRKSLACNPHNKQAQFNMGIAQLGKGDIEEGYKNFDARWEVKETETLRNFDMPRWHGEDVSGKNVLVWREQGVGDEIRYGSMLRDLQALGANVTFECMAKLIPLWANSLDGITLREVGPLECRGDENYSMFDYQVPLASLANVFKKDLSDYEVCKTPWLKRYHAIEREVRDAVSVQDDEVLIGISWRSRNQVESRNRFFFDIEEFAAFKDLPKTKWINLQYDVRQDELDTARELGLELHHVSNVDHMDDLVNASGVIGACDMLLTIGGSVGDIAGALGVPMIYIAPFNDPVFLGSDYVPWFPTAKPIKMRPNTGPEIITDILENWDSWKPAPEALTHHPKMGRAKPTSNMFDHQISL